MGSSAFSAAVVAGAFRFLWMGGALGSRGFRCRRCFGSVLVELPSVAALGLTVLPGFRPGFLRGRPAAVKTTLGGAGGRWVDGNRCAEPGSTTISSISMFARPWLSSLVGDPGSDRPEGGEDSDVGDEL